VARIAGTVLHDRMSSVDPVMTPHPV
jgi:hypothetical protein